MRTAHLKFSAAVVAAVALPFTLVGSNRMAFSTGLELHQITSCRYESVLTLWGRTACGPMTTDYQQGETVETLSSSTAKINDSDYQFNVKNGTTVVLESIGSQTALYKLVSGSIDYDAPRYDRPGLAEGTIVGRKAGVKKGRASVSLLGRGCLIEIAGSKLKAIVEGTADPADTYIHVQLDGVDKAGKPLTVKLKSGESGEVYW